MDIVIDILFLLSYFEANNFDFMIFRNKEQIQILIEVYYVFDQDIMIKNKISS